VDADYDSASMITGRHGLAATALAAVLVALATSTTSQAAFDPAAVRLSLLRVAGGLEAPLLVTNAGDGTRRLFVIEQAGRIRIVRSGTVAPTPFLDVSARISSGGERGLLGLAFHPAYESNGRFYVDYTDLAGNTVLSEFTASTSEPDIAFASSERVLLRIVQPYANHNGGALAFGPDGFLYIATGDGGSGGDPGNRAQSLATRLGKLLRIDVDTRTGSLRYGVPRTNPFVGRYGLDEIWALGLRNPWRFSFDRTTGDLWIGDVGQSGWEEIDRATRTSGGGRGRNFGWRILEGRACYKPAVGCSMSGKTPPIAVYSHSLGCAVTGGYVYRGAGSPILRGAYLFGDYCSGRIWSLTAAGPSVQTPRLLLSSGRAIASFGEDEAGEIYIADLAAGEILRVVATPR
jgi:glucose/arabinose dehydrogenase